MPKENPGKDPYPLIVTLQFDKEAQDYFNTLRKLHFPPEINYLDAHTTLFHHLPSDEPFISKELLKIAVRSAFYIRVTAVNCTGNGVALALEAKKIQEMHARLQKVFGQWLIPQDTHTIKPHVTIQNKVSAATAKELSLQLQKDFVPFSVRAIGINTWLYKNGPWDHVVFYPFSETDKISSS